MKRSRINQAVLEAKEAFERHGWVLPPKPRWDVTDFGLGDFETTGLSVINLAEEVEYCEKLMYVKKNQVTPQHYHKAKKEDIICRYGRLAIQLFPKNSTVSAKVDGEMVEIPTDNPLVLESGQRITLVQELPHEFWADSDYAVVGEVSTANDDLHDNFFANPDVGRFSELEEDEPAIVNLVSD